MFKKIKISVLVFLFSSGISLFANVNHNNSACQTNGFSGHYSFDDNPLKNKSLTKKGFTDNAWKWVNKLIKTINIQQGKNNTLLTLYKAQMEKNDLSHKKMKKIRNKIADLLSRNIIFEQIKFEISVLAASDQIYNVIEDALLNATRIVGFADGTAYGYTLFNVETQMIDIKIPTLDNQLALFAHELKHAYQFETGAVSFGIENVKCNPLYDQNDELEAYKRGALFGGEKMSAKQISQDNIYRKLPKEPLDATNYLLMSKNLDDCHCLQKISNKFNCVFRINGFTFIPIDSKI